MQSKLLLGLLMAFATSAVVAGNPDASTITVSGTFDGGGKTYNTSCTGGSENQAPLFELKNGATIKNLHIGTKAADGIHCEGSCTISNVTWDKVCEDAATLLPGGSSLTITNSAGKDASDKMFQHNAANGTITVNNFTQTGAMGKLVRSCGDCTNNGKNKHIVINSAKLEKASSGVVGINTNYGDTAKIRNLQIKGWKSGSPKVCVAYVGVQKGSGSSTKIGERWRVAVGSLPADSHCDVVPADVKAY